MKISKKGILYRVTTKITLRHVDTALKISLYQI